MFGQTLGLTREELEMIDKGYMESPLFTEKEKAVIRWAEAMTLNQAKYDVEAWNQLSATCSVVEIVEVSMASGLFNMVNRLNDSFHTELEPEEYNQRQRRGLGVTKELLEQYACEICNKTQ